MTRNLVVPACLLIGGFALFGDALAERPTEPRESASYVVTGTVSKLFTRDPGDDSEFVDHIVQIRIEGVERGDGYGKGDFIYTSVMRRKPGARTDLPGIGGHRGLPEEGQRIRAWIKHARGKMEGLYPRWFEVLDQPADDSARPDPLPAAKQ
jgi:hypothetical protein